MRKIIGIFFSLIVAVSTYAQYHNNHKYLIDAAVFTDDSALYFVAHEYPQFYDQANDSIAFVLNEKMKENSPFESFKKLETIREISSLMELETNELMDAKSLLQMLRNRIGLADFDMRDTAYIVNILINKAEFPDRRYPFFNHRQWKYIKTGTDKDFKVAESLNVLDAASGELLTIGAWGGEDAMLCLEAELKEAGLDNVRCDESNFDKMWKTGVLMNWVVYELNEDSIALRTSDAALDCEQWDEPRSIYLEKSCRPE